MDDIKDILILRKRGLDVRQARRMVQDRIGANGGCFEGECMGRRVEVRMWPSLQLKGHKGENFLFFFSFLSFVSLLL